MKRTEAVNFDCHFDGDITRCDKDCAKLGVCKRRTTAPQPEQKPVAWMLKTGHGTKIVEVKPPCEVDLWKPLYLAPTDSGREG